MQQPWVLRRLLLLGCVLMLFDVANGFPHGGSSSHVPEQEHINMLDTWNNEYGDSSEAFPEAPMQTHEWFGGGPQHGAVEGGNPHLADIFTKKRKRRDVRAILGGLLLAKDTITAGIRTVQKIKSTLRQLRSDDDDDDEPLDPIDVDAILSGRTSSKGNRQGRQNGSGNDDENSIGQEYGHRSQLSQRRIDEEWGYE